MYICAECGKTFENLARWKEPHGEELCGCPYCGGGVEEAEKCEICGEYHLEEDLTNGVCEDCIEKEIDYDTVLGYLKSRNLLCDFFLSYYWGCAERIKDTEEYDANEINGILENVFKEKSESEKKFGGNHFLKLIKEYIYSDIYDWAEYLREEVYR